MHDVRDTLVIEVFIKMVTKLQISITPHEIVMQMLSTKAYDLLFGNLSNEQSIFSYLI